MPQPRIPLAKAKLTGAAAKNPQRFRDRKEPETSSKPVGNPPAYLGRDAKAVWKEAAKEFGWLVIEDRFALEVMAVAVGTLREATKGGAPVTASMITAANTSIGKLGASPTDRGKVFQAADDEEEHDPFAQFGSVN
jgi:phage terminase small subunit